MSTGALRRTSPGVPPNMELEPIREGVPCPLGDTDLEPVGVAVEAKRDETEAFTPR